MRHARRSNSTSHWLIAAVGGALFGVVCGIARAQAPADAPLPSSRSFLPFTQAGYVGLSGGRSRYDLYSGPSGLAYDDSDTAWKLSTGGYFHRNFGVELGYLDFGRSYRLDGRTKAQGVNLSLVGRAPIGDRLELFAKAGTTYSRTVTSAQPVYGLRTGRDSGMGLSFGVGASWGFTPNIAAVLEWERHRLHFADDTAPADMATVGVRYRF
jgi:opacity protein-like surface antigen